MIQGQVEDRIDLKENNITVGKRGRVKGDIYGKVVSIEGEVRGNLFAGERIVLRQSGRVRGDMRAPVINLADGAKFKGNVATESTVKKSSQHSKNSLWCQTVRLQLKAAKNYCLESHFEISIGNN